MKISTRGFGFLFYVGLVACLLLGSLGMPVTAQEVATPATVDLGNEPEGDEKQPDSTGSKTEPDSSNVEVPNVSTDSVDSATDDGPMYSSADATILNSADWLTVYTPTGTVSPETTRTYDFTITNLRTVDSTLQVDIWVPWGARVIIPERYNAFYSCVSWGAGVSCSRQTQLTPGNFTNFTFDVALADGQNPATCPSLIELDVAFLVGGIQRTFYADTITPTCPVQTTQPKIEANAAIKDSADQTVTRPATAGDNISYQVSVTNPDTEPMTISSFSKAIPPELVSLGWTVNPNTSLSPGGPCVFDNGTLGCSFVELVGGETFTIELQSGAIPESYEDCGTFTSSATASGGLTSSAVSVTIECPPTLPDWFTWNPPTGTISPETLRRYSFTLTNPTAYADFYNVDIAVPQGTKIIIPESLQNSHFCSTLGSTVSCAVNSRLAAGASTDFWFDVTFSDHVDPANCPASITVDTDVYFYNGTNRVAPSDTSTPGCLFHPTITANTAIRTIDGLTVYGPGQIGDNITYEVSVYNPNGVPITVDSISKTLDPALVSLGWTVNPGSSASPDGPCTFGDGTLTCAPVQLDAGETFTVELKSGTIPVGTTACGTFTSSAMTSGGQTSAPVSVIVACPPPLPDWLVENTVSGTVSQSSERQYFFNIWNTGAGPDVYSVEIRVTPGAEVRYSTSTAFNHSCQIEDDVYKCTRITPVNSYYESAFVFHVGLDDDVVTSDCPALVRVQFIVEFSAGNRAEYSDFSVPTCPEQTTQPSLGASVTIKDRDGQTVTGPAKPGDSIAYKVEVTNPEIEAMTVDFVSKSIPQEILALGWTVRPTSALEPNGPCALVDNTLTCTSIELDAGETFTVELQSGTLPTSYAVCGTFTSTVTASGGVVSAPLSVTIECPPKFVIFPEINLGSFACEGSVSIIPMTSTSGEHIESMTVNQGLTDVTPTSGSTYEVKSGIPVRITFREDDGAFWPSPLPTLVDGGSWELVNDAQVFTFTPTQGDCAPYFQVTQTWVDANGNSIAGEPRLAPGSDLYIQVQVKNTGVSTITGLSYESILPTELRPITDQVRPPGDTTHNGQRCSTVTAEIMNSGVIYTMWSGKRCSLLQPNALEPGDSLSFQVWARVPGNPTASQCTSGIRTGASVTSVNNASVTIPGPAMTVSINCGTEPEVPTALRVKIELASGTSLEGAPWKLYAPVASQINQPIYDQGTVGPDNLIVFNQPTPPGSYRLVIEPPGMDVIDRVFETSDSATEITLQIDDEVENETPTPSPTPSPTTPGAGTTPEPSATTVPSEPVGVVTSLPNTGTGDGSGSILLLITGLTAVTLSLMSFGVLRKDSAR